MHITEHCKDRVERLHGIVTVEEVQECTARIRPQVGETWVLVKRLSEHRSIAADTPDKWVNGDTVWAVVKRQHERSASVVVTVLLRRWAHRVKGDHIIW